MTLSKVIFQADFTFTQVRETFSDTDFLYGGPAGSTVEGGTSGETETEPCQQTLLPPSPSICSNSHRQTLSCTPWRQHVADSSSASTPW